MTERISVRLENKITELLRMSQALEAFGQLHQIPAKVLHAANLSLDEILTNIISYGYDDGNEHQIILRFALETGELILEVEDDGRPFNPLELPEPDTTSPLEERPVGGLGIHFVRKLMDAVEYSRKDGKNLLVMKKKTKEA
jgi:anti-sigma regulatory factor (Ser/Thr protein kinase)